MASQGQDDEAGREVKKEERLTDRATERLRGQDGRSRACGVLTCDWGGLD